MKRRVMEDSSISEILKELEDAEKLHGSLDLEVTDDDEEIMSLSFKLKPRIKPRFGRKSDDGSADSNSNSSNTNPSLTALPAANREETKTSLQAPCFNNYHSPTNPHITPTCRGLRLNETIENSTPAFESNRSEVKEVRCNASSISESELLAANNVVQSALKIGDKLCCTKANEPTSDNPSKSPDSSKIPTKQNEVTVSSIREKPKSRILGMKQYKPVIKKQVRPISTPDIVNQPPASWENETKVKSSELNFATSPSKDVFLNSEKSESKLLVEVSGHSTAHEPESDTNQPLNTDQTLSSVHLDGNCIKTISTESFKLQKQNDEAQHQEIIPNSIQSEETVKSQDFSEEICQYDKIKCESDPPKKLDIVNVNIDQDRVKKHPLVKRSPKILMKTTSHDRSKPAVSNDSDKLSIVEVAPTDKVILGATDLNGRKEITSSDEAVADKQDSENVSNKNILIIDTTKSRLPTSSDIICSLGAVDSNTDSSDKIDPLDDLEQSNKTTGDKTKSGSFIKTKTGKSDIEDVRTLCAISAVDYLRRHDHALGESVIRRLIIGSKNMKNRNLKATMCSSCNPKTLQRCLASLWSFHKDELQAILKKSAERQKTPLTFATFSGKPSFKPSLVRQRAPTLTASTYGKMCFEVKEGLAKKYGPKAPELSKLRMLDLIFYNPSENPMSKKSVESDSSETSSKMSSTTSPSVSANRRSRERTNTENCTKSSDESGSDADDPETIEEDCNSMKISSSDKDSEQNNNNFPVPQVRIGDEGQIILAPESLVLKQQESKVLNSPVVHESDFAGVVRKRGNLNRTSWSFEETVKFYKSLHGMGTDFTSMLTLFPSRTRKNLKAKFKREERKNSALIDKVLSAQGQNLTMADVEKDLAADKTLRRLCIESAAQKYSTSSSVSCILQPSRRRRNKYCSDDEEEPRQGSTQTYATTVSNKVKSAESSSDPVAKKPENETEDRCKSDGQEEETPTDIENAPSEEESVKLHSKKPSEAFKKPIGRPPTQRKRKLNKKTPNIIKRERRSKSNEPPPLHKMCIDESDDNESKEDVGGDTTTDSTTAESISDLDDCFVIKTNFENKSFNCLKSVKFSVENPDFPVDVNATIEHKSSFDEVVPEIETELDESVEIVQVVTININQLPSYLEQTGAVVIKAEKI